MTEKALEARKAYKREWAKKHPDKIRNYQARYWAKRAEAAANEKEQASKAAAEPPNRK